MDEQPEKEVTLGTGKLLAIFFGLVVVCGIFFAMGYKFGQANAPIPIQEPSNSSTAVTGGPKPPSERAQPVATTTTPPDPDTPCTGANCNSDSDELSYVKKTGTTTPPATKSDAENKPVPEMSNGGKGFIVQVAALTKQEDADALVKSLQAKKYPVFLVSSTATDKYFHVQVGPFKTIDDAETMRDSLVKAGYDAVLKK